MRALNFSLIAVLCAVAFGLVGSGLQSDIIGLCASMSGFSTSSIGLMMASYYAGYSIAALGGHVSICRFGHTRVIAASMFLAAVVIALHPVLVMPLVWAALRFASGFAMALCAVGIESWINERAGNAARGRIFSIYMTVQVAAITLSHYILTLGNPMSGGLFFATSMLFACGVVPILLARKGAPHGVPPQPLPLLRLCRTAPLGSLSVLIAGIAWATQFSMGPVFAQRIGLHVSGVGLFMGLMMGGGALLQFPIGWLSDRYGRRRVLAGLFLCGIAAALFGWWAVGQGMVACLIATTLMGAASFPVYTVAAARTNDAIGAEERVAAAAGLLLMFGLGSILGPLLCAAAMPVLGAGGYYAVLSVAMVVGAGLAFRLR